MFKKRDNIKEVEEGKYLAPKFDENGHVRNLVKWGCDGSEFEFVPHHVASD